MVLLEEGREPHRVVAGLNSLHSTNQSPIAGEEISEGAFYWVATPFNDDQTIVKSDAPSSGAPWSFTNSPPSPHPSSFPFSLK